MSAEIRLLRRPDVCRLTGLKRSRLDQLEASGVFPRRVRISERAVAWVEAEVRAFIAARVAERDRAAA